MEKTTTEIENPEVADKMVKLRPSQKQLLEGMKLANKESLADVLDRILEEKEELAKKVEEKFNKSAIKKHNESIKNYMERILAINEDIERQAKDMIEMEVQKYVGLAEKVEEDLIDLANINYDLEEIRLEYDKLKEKSDNLEQKLQQEEKINEEETEKFVCPECGNESIIPTGGCGICLQCGYSKCN